MVNDEERERLLEEYDRSGLTQKAFAAQVGIKYATFVGWLSRRRRERRGEEATSAVKFEAVGTLGGFSAGLEVEFPDGMIVRGGQPGAVAALVEHLRRKRGC